MPDVGGEIAIIEKSDIPAEEKYHRKDELMRDFSIKSERIHSVNQLLKAYTLFEKDTEYILDEGKVKIVDEQTGRVLDGRRYSDGLHQAIEAKENVKVEDATQTIRYHHAAKLFPYVPQALRYDGYCRYRSR